MSSKPKSRTGKSSEMVPAASKQWSASSPTEEQIRLKAFEKYCTRAQCPGDAAADWLEAERELRQLRKTNGSALLSTVDSGLN